MTARLPRRSWAILLLVAVAARLMALGNPVIHADEEFYLVVARAMTHGALPYVDIWDRKPIGLFLLYWPAALLPGVEASWAYQLLALAFVVVAAGAVTRLAAEAGWQRGALLAGVAYILWLDPLGGVGGQSPVFYNVPMALAAGLVIAASRGRRAPGVAAMLIVGMVLQIKYAAVFEGLFFGLWLLAAEWRARRSAAGVIGYGAVLVGAALLPTAIAAASYAALGHLGAFVFANFTSVMGRNRDPWREALTNAVILTLILSPLVAMAIVGRREHDGGDPLARRFAHGWLAASLAGVVLFGGWFDHYGLPVVLPGALCAAAFLGSARRWTVAAILAAVAIAGQATVLVNRLNRGGGAELAALAQAIGRGPRGCLYVYSGNVTLYPAAGRCAPSRYIFPSHLNRLRETGAIGVDQLAEIGRILATRPAVIVMRPPFGGERPAARQLVLAAVARDYRLAARLPMGGEQLAVYARR